MLWRGDCSALVGWRRTLLTAWAMALSVRLWPRGLRSRWSAPTSSDGDCPQGSGASEVSERTGLLGVPLDPDPMQVHAAQVSADDLAACRVPSVRAIRAQLHVGQPRAQRLRDCLAAGACKASRCVGCVGAMYRERLQDEESKPKATTQRASDGLICVAETVGLQGRCR